ncbi:hypothetical protein HPB50_017733 [Hyalomma asiaticum]|uniref:Uncharacterized protein n=1 Tax=Hyalomma asiaticum TaxID=266040 RepID=A0ACB7SWX2_HYAAI|nr:hypothetical protein HPB50_017733 [Hyalomma asiaticum]
MSTIPNRLIQAALDTCLKTSRFQGFVLHKPTNTISVWVSTMALVEKVKELQQIRITEEYVLLVQAYLASGTGLHRYVINSANPDEAPEMFLQELYGPTHKVVTARYMGQGHTCLITLQGPQSSPERILYYGCVLHPWPFKPPVVFCYSRFRQGHMKSSCPCSIEDETTGPEATMPFRCGLCQTNDHDIASASCPIKLKATKRARQRGPRRPAGFLECPSKEQASVYNCFTALASLEDDVTNGTTTASAKDSATPTYTAAVKTSSARPRRVFKLTEDPPFSTENEEAKIDTWLASRNTASQAMAYSAAASP